MEDVVLLMMANGSTTFLPESSLMSSTSLPFNSTTEPLGNCTNLLDEVDWSQPALIISLVILGVVNVLVLAGNCLVVLAVFLDSKLRTVTNLFIVSLAMADLSVGVAVLPFSASLEVLDLWIFGEIWCSIWLAVDVWMCTASILNLCAISLDRYLAVTRPVSYPSIMTPFRAKILLAVVWLLSFLICFPPLVGWNDRKVSNRGGQPSHCDHWTCELTNDPGYVVYSALGSFFIPMFVMLFFYWRIYRAAVETTKAINQGFRTTKDGSRGPCNVENKERLTLRIHRGRSSQKPMLTSVLMAKHGVHPPGLGPALASLNKDIVTHLTETVGAAGSNVATGSGTGPSGSGASNSSSCSTGQPPVSLAKPLMDCDLCGSAQDGPPRPERQRRRSNDDEDEDDTTGLRENVSNASQAYKVLYMETPLCGCSHRGGMSGAGGGMTGGNGGGSGNKRNALEIFQTGGSGNKGGHHRSRSGGGTGGRRKNNRKKGGQHRAARFSNMAAGTRNGKDMSSGMAEEGEAGTDSGNKPVHKLNRRNIKAQVKRFKMETKAAKTLGIIVGGFIVCWMPFFTMYVVRAFCPECIPSILFSILFWLGYCNSAINPCIYALFSKDFRFAFQKIVCQCLCTRRSHSQHLSCIKMMIPQGMIGGLAGVNHFNMVDDSEFVNDHSESN